MFDSSYPYQQATINKAHLEPQVIKEIIFRFSTDYGVKYIVRLHEYNHKVFAIKFHLRIHNKLKNKYNLVVTDSRINPGKVIRTIVSIALDILKIDDMASFAFVGVFKVRVNCATEKISNEHPETAETQRYRIYVEIVENFFGTETFKHGYNDKANAYLLLNKNNKNYLELYDEVSTMFINTFQDLGNLQ